MKLLDIINFSGENQNEKNLAIIKNSGLPNVIYGAGVYADWLYQSFIERGITINDVFVDEEYYHEGSQFHGIPIKTVQEIAQNYKKVNIIVGIMPMSGNIASIQQKLLKQFRKDCVLFFVMVRELGELERINGQYIRNHINEFQQTFDWLEDKKSQQSYVAYLNQSINCNVNEMHQCIEEKQYFPDFLHLEKDEIFVDCGAYIGDSIAEFIKEVKGSYGQIIAFEPDEKNYEQLVKNFGENKKCRLINKGAFNSRKTLRFNSKASVTSSVSEEGNTTVEVDTIDQVLNGRHATYIKMDIEGSELAALNGAQQTIISSHPMLAICIYHKKEDLIKIPQYIKSLVPQYRFYLRAYTCFCTDVVLYAMI